MKRFRRIARQLVLLLLPLLKGLWTLECAAAPLLLRGTATMAAVHDDVQYEGMIRSLPFAAQAGDKFQFYLCIDPQLYTPDKPNGSVIFRSTIGGVHLEHRQLEVTVVNDSGVEKLSLHDPREPDMPPLEGDGIFIQRNYRLGTTDYAGATSAADGLTFSLELRFLEYIMAGRLPYPAILNDVSIPQEASTWQAFSDRKLILDFENSTFVGAYINDVVVIPEPSTLAISCCCFNWLGIGIRFARMRSNLVLQP